MLDREFWIFGTAASALSKKDVGISGGDRRAFSSKELWSFGWVWIWVKQSGVADLLGGFLSLK